MADIEIHADFTLDELVEFIGGGTDDPPEGYRSSEDWAEHFRVTVRKMRTFLRRAQAAGRLNVSYTGGRSIDGKGYKVPIYAFTKGEEDEDSV